MNSFDDDEEVYTFTGTSTVQYAYEMGVDDEYGRGYIELGADRQPAKFFRIRPNTKDVYETLIKVKSRSLELHNVALLIPLVIAKDHDDEYIEIGFCFTESFQEFINSGRAPPLFYEENGEMSKFWIIEINNLLRTIIEMHKGFLYQGRLCGISSYVIVRGSIGIVLTEASMACESRNKDREAKDLEKLGEFLESLVSHTGSKTSTDWTDFVNGFKTGKESRSISIGFVKHHPVLKDNVDQYGYIRFLLTRVRYPWDLNKIQSEQFRNFVEFKFPNLSQEWNKKITLSKYQSVFSENAAEYDLLSNISMLRYVENAMKHKEEEGHERGMIVSEIKSMFPGLFLQLHKTCASFSVDFPQAKILPEDN